jgi:hypothetical protein
MLDMLRRKQPESKSWDAALCFSSNDSLFCYLNVDNAAVFLL